MGCQRAVTGIPFRRLVQLILRAGLLLSMSRNRLIGQSVHDIASAVRNGNQSSLELVEAALDRIATLDELNAFVTVIDQSARRTHPRSAIPSKPITNSSERPRRRSTTSGLPAGPRVAQQSRWRRARWDSQLVRISVDRSGPNLVGWHITLSDESCPKEMSKAFGVDAIVLQISLSDHSRLRWICTVTSRYSASMSWIA